MKERERLYGGYKSKEEQQAKHQLWKGKNPDKVREHNRRYYEKHKDKLRKIEALRSYKKLEGQRKCREKLKIRVLTHYGNGKLACVMCGESRLACLSLDHVENDGARHRKGLKQEIYSWIEHNNYPDGFQTLCMNCQWVKKAEYGKTHREKKSKYLEDG